MNTCVYIFGYTRAVSHSHVLCPYLDTMFELRSDNLSLASPLALCGLPWRDQPRRVDSQFPIGGPLVEHL